MINIAIIGAGGRMGLALIRCSGRFEDLSVSAALEQPGSPAIGKDVGILAGCGKLGITISDDPSALQSADVWIDFSFHEAVPGNVIRATEMGKAVVVGTTGLTDDEGATVKSASGKIPVVWAPNMGLGMNVLFVMVEQAARILGLDYDVEIVEVHHRLKKDAPSGTALRLAQGVAAGRDQQLDTAACFGREGLVGERPRGEIGIHAVRSGDVMGDHTVSFAAEGERIEFVHRASSRDTFAMGALKAARWVGGREPGLYDMKHVLGL